jgi:glycine/D-amino acid oxidase-like deaminating enzyme
MRSSWASDGLVASAFPRLTTTEVAEIAIVGGGISGVSTALNLAQLGHRPILVEAQAIGSGATGASAGIVAPQLVRIDFEGAIRKLGREHARLLFGLVADAGNYVFQLARDHSPSSEAEQNGFLAPAANQASLRRIESIAAGWADFRDDISILDADAFRALSGLRGYAGAMLDASGGTINPLRYTADLADAARQAGAQIFCDSPVVALKRTGSEWLITTPEGAVRARRVLLCANGGNPAIHPALARTILPIDVCELTTAPLSAALRARILPGRQALTDVELDVFTIRYDRDGGLVTAYPGTIGDMDKITGAVNARLAAAIPEWEPLPITHIWHGRGWLDAELLPRLVQVEDGLIAVQACNGRGIAFNSILGRDLARWIAGDGKQPPPLPLEAPKRISGMLLARYVPQLALRAGLLAKRFRQFLRVGS